MLRWGSPLQYSCLETPMDGGAWWAAVHGVAKSRTHWATSLSLFTFMHWRRKWQPTPVFLPEESQGRGSLVGCRLWGHTESHWSDLAAAAMVKNPPASVGDIKDMGSIPVSGRCPGGGQGSPLQYSHLENPTNRRAWQVTVQGHCRVVIFCH